MVRKGSRVQIPTTAPCMVGQCLADFLFCQTYFLVYCVNMLRVETGIDPYRDKVGHAEALQHAPGIDPVTEMAEGREAFLPSAGYLIESSVRLGDGTANTQLYRFDQETLRLGEATPPGTMYGMGHLSVRMDGGFASSVICGNIFRAAAGSSEFDLPGSTDIASGRARITTIGDTGNFVAVTEEYAVVPTLRSIKSNGHVGSAILARSEAPAQFVRMVTAPEEVYRVGLAIGEAAGLDEVGQALHAAKVREQIHAMDRATGRQEAFERRLGEAGWLGSLIATQAQRFGFRLS